MAEEEGSDLARPEFDGLWDQHKPYKAPLDGNINQKPLGGSKMQKVRRMFNSVHGMSRLIGYYIEVTIYSMTILKF